MNHVFMPIAMFGGLVLGLAGITPPSSPEDARPFTIEEVMVSTTSDIWWCGECVACGANKKDVVTGQNYDKDYTNAECQYTETCNFPICLNQEDQQEEEDLAALTHEQMIDVSDRVLSGSAEDALYVLTEFPTKVRFVESRGSIQIHSCDGSIVANLPLTNEQLDVVLAEQQ